MKAYVICRPINGISINGLEYLNDENGETYHFTDEAAARWNRRNANKYGG